MAGSRWGCTAVVSPPRRAQCRAPLRDLIRHYKHLRLSRHQVKNDHANANFRAFALMHINTPRFLDREADTHNLRKWARLIETLWRFVSRPKVAKTAEAAALSKKNSAKAQTPNLQAPRLDWCNCNHAAARHRSTSGHQALVATMVLHAEVSESGLEASSRSMQPRPVRGASESRPRHPSDHTAAHVKHSRVEPIRLITCILCSLLHYMYEQLFAGPM